jgi:RNA-dependent RNA polymerase
MEEEHTFISLQRVITKRSADLSFTIDLRRKRIVVNFAHSFVDPRSQGVSDFISSNEIGKLDRDEHYMFHIPFGQLHTIKHLDYDGFGIQDFFGLAITLDTPPSFFRKQLGDNAGHSDGSLSWTEFDTWYRQTDIDYDPYRLQHAKVSLHKAQPEIDIGIASYPELLGSKC